MIHNLLIFICDFNISKNTNLRHYLYIFLKFYLYIMQLIICKFLCWIRNTSIWTPCNFEVMEGSEIHTGGIFPLWRTTFKRKKKSDCMIFFKFICISLIHISNRTPEKPAQDSCINAVFLILYRWSYFVTDSSGVLKVSIFRPA